MDDLISRKQAIEALKEHRALYCDNTPDTFSKLSYAEKSRVDELDTAIATLVNLPSAQPKQGHWIEHKWAEEVNGMLVSNYECSECHYWERYNSNFCPNCGAKMEGVKE